MARGETTAIKTIVRVERLKSSVNGNPRYRLHFDDATSALTQSNSSCAYEIQNQFVAGVTFELTLTRAGRVCGIRKALQPMDCGKAFRHLAADVDLFMQGQLTRAALMRNVDLLRDSVERGRA